MLSSIGIPELICIGIVAIVLFGPSKIGDLMKGLGNGIREFKSATKEAKDAAAEVKK